MGDFEGQAREREFGLIEVEGCRIGKRELVSNCIVILLVGAKARGRRDERGRTGRRKDDGESRSWRRECFGWGDEGRIGDEDGLDGIAFGLRNAIFGLERIAFGLIGEDIDILEDI